MNSVCVASRTWRLSRRSEITPPKVPKTRMGRYWSAAVRPRYSALWVSEYTSQPCATVCIQVPLMDTV